jgi:hypothetical protein
MGMDAPMVVHAKPIGGGFTFFVVYGPVSHVVDVAAVEVVEREYPLLSPKEANATVRETLRRKLVVVGACIGTDAHTVGIDAILNVKGWAGEKGLEYYREMKVVNMGAQVSVPELVERAATSGRTRSSSARSSPSGTRTCTTPRPCPPRSARRSRRRGARCWSSAGRASTSPPPLRSASTGCSVAAPRPGRWRATSSTPSPPVASPLPDTDRPHRRARPTPRYRCPGPAPKEHTP